MYCLNCMGKVGVMVDEDGQTVAVDDVALEPGTFSVCHACGHVMMWEGGWHLLSMPEMLYLAHRPSFRDVIRSALRIHRRMPVYHTVGRTTRVGRTTTN